MHHVAFVVYPGFELLDASGPAAAFNSANRALQQEGRAAFYNVVMACAGGGPVTSSSGIAVQAQAMEEIARRGVDTVLVVGAEQEHLMPIASAMSIPVVTPAEVQSRPSTT